MEDTKNPRMELPEWLKWLLLPFSIVLIIVGAIALVLYCLFCLLIGKRKWAATAIETAFESFDAA